MSQQEMISELEEENSLLEQKVKAIHKKCQSLRKLHRQQDEKIADLEEENDLLKQKVETFEEEHTILRELHSKMKTHILESTN